MSKLKFVLAVILVLLGVVSGASVVRAQATSTILGVVSDPSGASVPDANVTVTNTETNATRTAVTGSDGSYRVPALQPGHYIVTVAKSGFSTVTQQALELVVDQSLPVNISLSVGSTSQAITVTTEAPQVDTTTSSLGGLVNEAKIEDLPLNGRNFVDLATLQAGVTLSTNSTFKGTSGTGFSSNGAPMRSNNFTLDGAPLANVRGNTSGAVGTTLGVDGIKEYKVITNAFSAEYGLNMGSQVVIVSKGGTNQFHGDAFEYLRNSALDARNYFDNSHITTGKRLPALRRNQFGASFGGPIQKDKTFFYAVYEVQRLKAGATNTANVFPANCHVATANPCATASTAFTPVGTVATAIQPFLALYPNPNIAGNKYFTSPVDPTSVDYGQIRVDHNFSDKDSLFGRWTVQDGRSLATSAYPGLGTTFFGRDQFITLSENHIFTSTVLNTVRVSWSRTPVSQGLFYPAAVGLPPFQIVAGQPLGSFTIGGITGFSTAGASPQQLKQNAYSFGDDVYYTKGKHAFKFGVLLNRFEYYTLSTNYVRGQISFSNQANFLAGKVTQLVAESPTQNDQTREARFYTYGMYAQDDWRVGSRLTLNLGLRYEPSSTPFDRKGANYGWRSFLDPGPTAGPTFRNATLKNFSPRVGFAWNVRGNGKTSVRAAFGEYFDVTGAGFSFYTLAQGSPPTSAQITISNFAINTLPINIVGQPGTTIRSDQYNLNSPHLLQWNMTVEQQLAPSLAMSVSYVGTRGIHLFTTEEANPCVPTSYTNGIPFWGSSTTVPCPNGRVNALANPTLPNPWGDNIATATVADSYYHSLQAVVSKRISHGLEVQGAYTWSHVLDDTQGLFFGSECNAGDGIDVMTGQLPGHADLRKKYNYGPSCFDVRHYLRVQVLYHFPNMSGGNKFVRGATNGWWIGDITSWQTGFPISLQTNNWRSNDLNMTQLSNLQTDHPDIGTATVAPGGANTTTATFIPYNAATVVTGNPNQWFNPLMFVPEPVGFKGNAPRGLIKGPHLANFDFSISKDTAAPFLGEAGKIQFRAEFFNILNHANFGLPASYIYAGNLTDGAYNELPLATAGQINSTVNTSRQIQLSLKLIF